MYMFLTSLTNLQKMYGVVGDLEKAVLIVDFDPSTRRTFRRILEKNGYNANEAANGEEARKKMKNHCYDAVLISLQIPDMDGIDLLLFAKQSLPNAAKIIHTGILSLESTIRAIEAGADGLFAKPVSPETLILAIRETLQDKETVLSTFSGEKKPCSLPYP